MNIEGEWYQVGSAKAYPAKLEIIEDLVSLYIESGNVCTSKLSKCKVSERVGNIPRSITFADNSVFVTHDNNAIDRLYSSSGIISKFERHLGLIMLAMMLVIFSIYGFIKVVIPAMSNSIAHALPLEVATEISELSLEAIDGLWANESALDTALQEKFQKRFASLIPTNSSYPYQLKFRSMDMANAFALPDGTIILTDELIDMVHDYREIDVVLLHEIGHVEYKHGLDRMVHASLLSVLLFFIFSDISAVGDVLIASPLILLQTNYSRTQELEADAYAAYELKNRGVSPEYLVNILTRLHEEQGAMEGLEYISTHPSVEHRAKSLGL